MKINQNYADTNRKLIDISNEAPRQPAPSTANTFTGASLQNLSAWLDANDRAVRSENGFPASSRAVSNRTASTAADPARQAPRAGLAEPTATANPLAAQIQLSAADVADINANLEIQRQLMRAAAQQVIDDVDRLPVNSLLPIFGIGSFSQTRMYDFMNAVEKIGFDPNSFYVGSHGPLPKLIHSKKELKETALLILEATADATTVASSMPADQFNTVKGMLSRLRSLYTTATQARIFLSLHAEIMEMVYQKTQGARSRDFSASIFAVIGKKVDQALAEPGNASKKIGAREILQQAVELYAASRPLEAQGLRNWLSRMPSDGTPYLSFGQPVTHAVVKQAAGAMVTQFLKQPDIAPTAEERKNMFSSSVSDAALKRWTDTREKLQFGRFEGSMVGLLVGGLKIGLATSDQSGKPADLTQPVMEGVANIFSALQVPISYADLGKKLHSFTENFITGATQLHSPSRPGSPAAQAQAAALREAELNKLLARDPELRALGLQIKLGPDQKPQLFFKGQQLISSIKGSIQFHGANSASMVADLLALHNAIMLPDGTPGKQEYIASSSLNVSSSAAFMLGDVTDAALQKFKLLPKSLLALGAVLQLGTALPGLIAAGAAYEQSGSVAGSYEQKYLAAVAGNFVQTAVSVALALAFPPSIFLTALLPDWAAIAKAQELDAVTIALKEAGLQQQAFWMSKTAGTQWLNTSPLLGLIAQIFTGDQQKQYKNYLRQGGVFAIANERNALDAQATEMEARRLLDANPTYDTVVVVTERIDSFPIGDMSLGPKAAGQVEYSAPQVGLHPYLTRQGLTHPAYDDYDNIITVAGSGASAEGLNPYQPSPIMNPQILSSVGSDVPQIEETSPLPKRLSVTGTPLRKDPALLAARPAMYRPPLVFDGGPAGVQTVNPINGVTANAPRPIFQLNHIAAGGKTRFITDAYQSETENFTVTQMSRGGRANTTFQSDGRPVTVSGLGRTLVIVQSSVISDKADRTLRAKTQMPRTVVNIDGSKTHTDVNLRLDAGKGDSALSLQITDPVKILMSGTIENMADDPSRFISTLYSGGKKHAAIDWSLSLKRNRPPDTVSIINQADFFTYQNNQNATVPITMLDPFAVWRMQSGEQLPLASSSFSLQYQTPPGYGPSHWMIYRNNSFLNFWPLENEAASSAQLLYGVTSVHVATRPDGRAAIVLPPGGWVAEAATIEKPASQTQALTEVGLTIKNTVTGERYKLSVSLLPQTSPANIIIYNTDARGSGAPLGSMLKGKAAFMSRYNGPA